MTAIVLAADDRYLPFLPCTLLQVSIHGRSADGVLLAVPVGTSSETVAPAVDAARRFGIGLEVVELRSLADLERRGAIAERGHVSSFTYSKLVLAEDLVDYDDVLYLDIDTLVRGSLEPLLEWPLRFELGGVPELGTNGMHLFGTVRTPYFNAGVLRMGLGRMRESGLWSRAQRILQKRPRLPFQDQDILNIVYRDAFDILPPTYNVFDLAVREAPPYFQVFHDPTIVHFVGPTKPWHRESGSVNAQEWRQTHAEALGLPRDRARLYVNGARRDSRHRVSAAIATVRFSTIGRHVRAALPYEVKHAANQAVLKVVPPRTRLAEEVLAGIVANRSPRARQSPRDAVGPRQAEPTGGALLSDRPVDPGTGSETAHGERRLSPPTTSDTGARSDLVLVASAPRSGTGAFGSLLEAGFPRAMWCGETYGGWVPDGVGAYLAAGYPWYAQPKSPAFVGRMDKNVLNITHRLMELSGGPTIIKVFGPHLSSGALDRVLREFSPRVIVLRRRMVFSCVSMRRSMRSGIWYGDEITDTHLALENAAVQDYVTVTDRRFDQIDESVAEHGLDALWLTYSDVFESRSALPALRSFLSDWELSPMAEDDESWLPRTAIQDRRSDESIEQVLRSFVGLTPENQRALLRLPGRRPAAAE